MKQDKQPFAGIILMGPFGSGKSYLGRQLNERGVARYTELEPIIYDLFSDGDDFDLKGATAYIRQHYQEQLTANLGLVAFESTGVVQRPLLLEMISRYRIALVRVCTPKVVCLQRVAQRNQTAKRPLDIDKADQFFNYWTEEIAPTYEFALEVDGTEADKAVEAIQRLGCG